MSGRRIAVSGPGRHPERGAARRAGRPPGEDPPDAGRRAGAAGSEARGIRLRHGHQSGRARHARVCRAKNSNAHTASFWSCSPRRESISRRCSSARISSARSAPAANPSSAWSQQYLDAHPIDAARSYMIGDRDTDLEFAANLGIQGLRIRLRRRCRGDLARHRPAHSRRRPPRAGAAQDQGNARSRSRWICPARGRAASPPGWDSSITCSSRSPSTEALRSISSARGDLHIDEHHTIEDCALALGRGAARGAGRQARHRPLRLPAGHGRGRGPGGARHFRPPVFRLGRPLQSRARRRHAHRAGAAFLSLARANRWERRCTFACAARIRII